MKTLQDRLKENPELLLKALTPEELATVIVPSREEIFAAIEKGREELRKIQQNSYPQSMQSSGLRYR